MIIFNTVRNLILYISDPPIKWSVVYFYAILASERVWKAILIISSVTRFLTVYYQKDQTNSPSKLIPVCKY